MLVGIGWVLAATIGIATATIRIVIIVTATIRIVAIATTRVNHRGSRNNGYFAHGKGL